jgi:hypothetical protein
MLNLKQDELLGGLYSKAAKTKAVVYKATVEARIRMQE